MLMHKVRKGVHQQDGQHELPLPLNDDNVKFHNNRAVHRFMRLMRKLKNSIENYLDYVRVMHDLICKVYLKLFQQVNQLKQMVHSSIQRLSHKETKEAISSL